jgi:hypothetical protein
MLYFKIPQLAVLVGSTSGLIWFSELTIMVMV